MIFHMNYKTISFFNRRSSKFQWLATTYVSIVPSYVLCYVWSCWYYVVCSIIAVSPITIPEQKKKMGFVQVTIVCNLMIHIAFWGGFQIYEYKTDHVYSFSKKVNRMNKASPTTMYCTVFVGCVGILCIYPRGFLRFFSVSEYMYSMSFQNKRHHLTIQNFRRLILQKKGPLM